MRLGPQEPRTNQGTSQMEERLLDLREPVQPAPQPPEGMQPGNGSLHGPAEHTPPAAMLGVPRRQRRGDPPPTQPLPDRLRVGPAVPWEAVRLLPLRARLAADGWLSASTW